MGSQRSLDHGPGILQVTNQIKTGSTVAITKTAAAAVGPVGHVGPVGPAAGGLTRTGNAGFINQLKWWSSQFSNNPATLLFFIFGVFFFFESWCLIGCRQQQDVAFSPSPPLPPSTTNSFLLNHPLTLEVDLDLFDVADFEVGFEWWSNCQSSRLESRLIDFQMSFKNRFRVGFQVEFEVDLEVGCSDDFEVDFVNDSEVDCKVDFEVDVAVDSDIQAAADSKVNFNIDQDDRPWPSRLPSRLWSQPVGKR